MTGSAGCQGCLYRGCVGTACAIADRDFGVPAMGTMAHSWVQMFPSELEAFRHMPEHILRIVFYWLTHIMF